MIKGRAGGVPLNDSEEQEVFILSELLFCILFSNQTWTEKVYNYINTSVNGDWSFVSCLQAYVINTMLLTDEVYSSDIHSLSKCLNWSSDKKFKINLVRLLLSG